jgi:hypothetical protein
MATKSSFAHGFKARCERIAAEKRQLLGLTAVDPLDMRQLAAHLGVMVWTPAEITGLDPACISKLTGEHCAEWSAVTLIQGKYKVVILNSAHSKARQASNLAHEISHLVLTHRPAHIEVPEDGLMIIKEFNRLQEEEADWLSGCLLLPREALVEARRQNLSDEEILERFVVSPPMLRYRLNVTAIDKNRVKGN